jgi:hypothetical protein
VWFDEHPEFNNSLYARASYDCDGESPAKRKQKCEISESLQDCSFGGGKHKALWFNGLDDDDDFVAWPHWNGETTCPVNERVRESSVESDDSDCFEVPVLLGQEKLPSEEEWECTIYNTRIYEGVPTLNQYGLALLALFCALLVGPGTF